tara:strand:- start:1027 stop:1146 length:120 start_codon:yes stop_codon:yes gene_type:complete
VKLLLKKERKFKKFLSNLVKEDSEAITKEDGRGKITNEK